MSSIFKEIDSKTLRVLKKKICDKGFLTSSKENGWLLKIVDHSTRDSGKYLAEIRNLKSGEGYSVWFFTFDTSIKSIVRIGVDALKAKDKFFDKKFKGAPFYFKQALRSCNKDNPRVKIPYFTGAVTYKNGKYYYEKLIDYDRSSITLGSGVKNKRDFLDYADKAIALANRTGCTGMSLRANWYSESEGFVMSTGL